MGPFIWHLNGRYELIPNSRAAWEDGRASGQHDLNETYGLGLIYVWSDNWQLLCELAGETGEEIEPDHRRWETELAPAPGVRGGVESEALGEFELGLAAPSA